MSRTRRGLLLAAFLCACALAIFSQRARHTASDSETSVSEIPMLRLEHRDGKLFRHNSKTPFTGTMVERYPNGALKSRSAVVDGLLNGSSEGFFPNGAPEIVEYFEAGTSHGIRKTWRQSGQLLSEGEIVGGKQEGTFRRWHENGTLEVEAEFKDGKPDGLSRSWYPSGFLKAEAVMAAGEVKERQFYEDGQTRDAVLLGSN